MTPPLSTPEATAAVRLMRQERTHTSPDGAFTYFAAYLVTTRWNTPHCPGCYHIFLSAHGLWRGPESVHPAFSMMAVMDDFGDLQRVAGGV